jgi:hypothetical protein
MGAVIKERSGHLADRSTRSETLSSLPARTLAAQHTWLCALHLTKAIVWPFPATSKLFAMIHPTEHGNGRELATTSRNQQVVRLVEKIIDERRSK